MTGRFTYLLKLWPFIGCFAMLLSCNQGNTSAGGHFGPAHLVPRAPSGWEKSHETLVFSGFALSDYINGGAEAYLAYGFKELAAQEFRSDTGGRLTVEIYEMDRSENAFGIFSTDSAGQRWPIGAEASYGDGLLRFWKGPYFVRILCFPPDSSIEAAIRETGSEIADAITSESRRPEILSLLPESGVFADTVCYFHRQTSLNNIRFVSDKNLLHLGDEVEALTWEEGVTEPSGPDAEEDERRLRQILLRYPSPAEAETAFRDFTETYLHKSPAAASEDRPAVVTAQLSDGAHVAAQLGIPWVTVVIDAPSVQAATSAVERTRGLLQAFDHREEPS